MLEIRCSGTPYEIGFQHGQAARSKIESSLAFYRAFFELKTGLPWNVTASAARKSMPMLMADWPHFIEEMQGIAQGAGVSFDSIMALNLRTEISMGLMADGCTCLTWKTSDASYMAQNWDWEPEQEENLVVLHIVRDGDKWPSICLVTEAGIIGKIGINSAGVGVCMNAIRVRGLNSTFLPVHLALRAVLDSSTRAAAVATLQKAKVAAAVHILIADSTGATSIEASSRDMVLTEDDNGKTRLAHSNHYLHSHAEGVPLMVVPDESVQRVQRVVKLMDDVAAAEGGLGSDEDAVLKLERILEDEDNAPFGVNKAGTVQEPLRTLFSIVMNLTEKKASVRSGRPTAQSGRILLNPCS